MILRIKIQNKTIRSPLKFSDIPHNFVSLPVCFLPGCFFVGAGRASAGSSHTTQTRAFPSSGAATALKQPGATPSTRAGSRQIRVHQRPLTPSTNRQRNLGAVSPFTRTMAVRNASPANWASTAAGARALAYALNERLPARMRSSAAGATGSSISPRATAQRALPQRQRRAAGCPCVWSSRGVCLLPANLSNAAVDEEKKRDVAFGKRMFLGVAILGCVIGVVAIAVLAWKSTRPLYRQLPMMNEEYTLKDLPAPAD